MDGWIDGQIDKQADRQSKIYAYSLLGEGIITWVSFLWENNFLDQCNPYSFDPKWPNDPIWYVIMYILLKTRPLLFLAHHLLVDDFCQCLCVCLSMYKNIWTHIDNLLFECNFDLDQWSWSNFTQKIIALFEGRPALLMQRGIPFVLQVKYV